MRFWQSIALATLTLGHKFNPGFRINLHIRDLNNALETGLQFGAPLPLKLSRYSANITQSKPDE